MLNPVRDQKRSGKYGRGPALARHLVVRGKQFNAAIFSCHDLVLEYRTTSAQRGRLTV